MKILQFRQTQPWNLICRYHKTRTDNTLSSGQCGTQTDNPFLILGLKSRWGLLGFNPCWHRSFHLYIIDKKNIYIRVIASQIFHVCITSLNDMQFYTDYKMEVKGNEGTFILTNKVKDQKTNFFTQNTT